MEKKEEAKSGMKRIIGLVLASIILIVCTSGCWWHHRHEGYDHEHGDHYDHEHGDHYDHDERH